jgi:hypothetical protein
VKKIAESLGMSPPERPKYEVGESVVESQQVVQPTAGQVIRAENPAIPDMAPEQARLERGDVELDDLIREGTVAFKEAFEKASDMEPRSQSRAREVGATIMNVVLSAIKHKQDHAIDRRNQKLKEAEWLGGGGPQTVNNTQINNIMADRNDILRMAGLKGGEGETGGPSGK